MRITRHLLAILIAAAPLHAATRSSVDYDISTETTDAAGRHSASADYTNEGSAGGIVGISTAAPSEVVKHSYIGQLYDPVGLTILSPAPTVNETESIQLSPWLDLDDGTFLLIPASEVLWAQSPAVSVSDTGYATAAAVYADTTFSVIGTHQTFTGVLDLSVLNFLPDNYGIYANDTLPDDWQVQYFGVGNPNARPTGDPDHDGQDNLFEYHASLDPTNPRSLFTVRVIDSGIGGHSVVFAPRLDLCDYQLLGSSDFVDWQPVVGLTSDMGSIRTIIDPNGTEPRRFYKVSVRRQ